MQDYDVKLRLLNEEFQGIKIKMETVYNTLPNVINDIVNARLETTISQRIQNFVSQDYVDEKIKDKLDSNTFKAFCMERMAKDEVLHRQLNVNDRFFDIKKQFETFVSRADLDRAVRNLVSQDVIDPLASQVDSLSA